MLHQIKNYLTKNLKILCWLLISDALMLASTVSDLIKPEMNKKKDIEDILVLIANKVVVKYRTFNLILIIYICLLES